MLSEINPLDLRVIAELFRSSRSENGSVIDNISAVSDLQGFSDIVVRDENPDALGFQMVDNSLNLQHRNRIDPRKRLIQQDELGRNHERPCNLHTAPFSSR